MIKALPDYASMLLVRFNSLGDVVKCTALPRLIKQQHPKIRLIFATLAQNAPLLAKNPYIDEVVCYPAEEGFMGLVRLAKKIRAMCPEIAIDLHNSLRSYFLRLWVNSDWLVYNKRSWQRWLLSAWDWDTYSQKFSKQADFLKLFLSWNIKDDGLGTEIHLGELERNEYFLKSFSDELQWLEQCPRPLLAVAPVSAWQLKCWPIDQMEILLKEFVSQCHGSVMLFGGTKDKDLNKLIEPLGSSAINLAGRTSFLESAWFASKASLMVANDTGMAHIAEAVGVNTLVFFGPTTEHWGFFPQRVGSKVLQRSLPCRPCTHSGKGRCHHPWQQACLASIAPQHALQQIRRMLDC